MVKIIIILSLLGASPSLSQTEGTDQAAADQTRYRVEAESLLTGQLTQELGALLPERRFAVFSSIQITWTRQSEVTGGERSVDGGADTSPIAPAQSNTLVPALPGFKIENNDSQRPRAPKKQDLDRQIYRVIQRPEITGVEIRLILDSGLNPALTAVAKQVLAQRVKSSYGQLATSYFQEAQFQIPEPPVHTVA
ncbi:MAG: hypothetical protein AAB425_12040, partial [Bdellovibrionota bacterium]